MNYKLKLSLKHKYVYSVKLLLNLPKRVNKELI